MYSRCSHCQAQQAVNIEQLRDSRGLLTCSACGKRFDALASLSDQAEAQSFSVNSGDFLPNLSTDHNSSPAWKWGSGIAALAFLIQLVYFEGSDLLRQPWMRAGLQAFCEPLHCRLPAYKNLEEWAVSHSDFQNIASERYLFSAAITNQAPFSQVCPDLKLVLLDFKGNAVAERVFPAGQYVSVTSLAAHETAQVSLAIVAPSELGNIGGYTFKLL